MLSYLQGLNSETNEESGYMSHLGPAPTNWTNKCYAKNGAFVVFLPRSAETNRIFVSSLVTAGLYSYCLPDTRCI
jgi:hypothetical protein